jgi:putative nucleotidyltransferase with HDIG domain
MIPEEKMDYEYNANEDLNRNQNGFSDKPKPFFSYNSFYPKKNWKKNLIHQIEMVNKELWLILSMFVIVGLMNYLVASHRILLGLYTLPTLFSAYFYGRRHATLTALASVLLVSLGTYYNPAFLNSAVKIKSFGEQWYDVTAWASILVITAYAMGTLYEHKTEQVKELRRTYQGIVLLLRQFISKDEYTSNHCYRVSFYAARIAANLGFSPERIEDIRSASLLHDLGKIKVSREILYKAAQLTKDEYEKMKGHVDEAVDLLMPLGNPLGRIIPIILSHHEKYDGKGYHNLNGENIPLEARILTVADVYDSLVSDRPYRKAMSPFDAKNIISKGSGTEFDPKVVKAFTEAFRNGELEVPNIVV